MQILSTNSKFVLIALLSFISLYGYTQDFEVAPVLVSFDANPGEVQTQVITVRNHGNERHRFVLNLVDYSVDEEGAKISLETGSSERSLVDWMTINPSILELNPNQSAEANLVMTVPRTGFNTRWGMIQVEVAREQMPHQADKQLATGVVVVPRIVVLVKQSPRSNQNYKGTVTDLREVEKTNSGQRNFEAILINTGDKILDAKVFLALANLETAEEMQYRPIPVTIYPGYQRRVVLTLPDQPEPGQYALAFMMDYGHRAPVEGAQILLTVE
jgi:hypothetical protein